MGITDSTIDQIAKAQNRANICEPNRKFLVTEHSDFGHLTEIQNKIPGEN